MTWMNFALVSDRLVLAAIAVFALAMVALAAHSATRSGTTHAGLVPRLRSTVRRDAVVGVGAVPGVQVGREAGSDPDGSDTSDHEAPPRFSASGVGTSLLVLGLLLTVAAAITRGLAAGRTPWSNMYEFTVVGTAAIVGCYLVLAQREATHAVRVAGVWVAAAATLFLGLALTVLYTPAAGLIPVLDSAWLVVHVAAAIIAGGLFSVGAVVSVVHLVQVRRERRGRDTGPWSATTLERTAQAVYTFAFPIWTFAVIAGAIWAENSWGRYWGWDPKETWAFITWVCYAAYLHAQATSGWRGKKATWLALAGYLAFLFNFVGVNIWVGGLHSYSGV